MFNRLISLTHSESLLLFGARGTGKSTLLKHELPAANSLWIDLLNYENERRYGENPDLLSQQIRQSTQNLEWVVIDEVQKLPRLLDIVHLEIEKARSSQRNLRFALSGSSARKLKRGGANLLAGRAVVLYLYPFSHIELGETISLDESLTYGTLPTILQHKSREAKLAALAAYVETYIREEIIAEQIVRSIQPFRAFLELAAECNGHIVNYKTLSLAIGVDDKTIKSYFEILEDTLIGYTLPAYDRSLRKQQIKSPKFYLFDTGVARTLNRLLPASGELTGQEYGRAFEQFIICECFRLLGSSTLSKARLYHYTSGNLEIDLVIERPREPLTFVEIKSTDRIVESHLKGLRTMQKQYPEFRYICLSKDTIARNEGGIEVLPWKLALASLNLYQPNV
jgi:uncharacterized protein